jgi:hypothetical protein
MDDDGAQMALRDNHRAVDTKRRKIQKKKKNRKILKLLAELFGVFFHMYYSRSIDSAGGN